MIINIPEADDIYFTKTREYFQEVLSSYASGNYRSAVVMLYSVAICDILFKLQELSDMYNDNVAKQILKDVESIRKDDSDKSKSQWEKDLVKKVYEKTELLNRESYTNLLHLQDYRNFSAHPALNDNYELISPSKESTIACITNTLKDVLVKPPVFIKQVVSMLTDDLKDKIEIYRNNRQELESFLNNRYYRKMNQTMKTSTFRALWKFCFILLDDEDCINNRRINRMALEILLKDLSLIPIIESEIKSNELYYTVAFDGDCIRHLILMLAKYPSLYNPLSVDTKLKLDSQIDKDSEFRIISWFKYSSLQEHIAYLENKTLSLNRDYILAAQDKYKTEGEFPLLLDYFITLYGRSAFYDTANSRFDILIEPNLSAMTRDQVINLIEVTNSNNQIYGRRYSFADNTTIVKRTKDRLGVDFDYSKYNHFDFDKDVLDNKKESSSTADEVEDD